MVRLIAFTITALMLTLSGCGEPADEVPGDPQHEMPYPGTEPVEGDELPPDEDEEEPLAAVDLPDRRT